MLSPKLVGFSIFSQVKLITLVLTLSSDRHYFFTFQANHQRLTSGINMLSFVLYMHFTSISSELSTKSSTNLCSTFAKRYFAVCTFFSACFAQNFDSFFVSALTCRSQPSRWLQTSSGFLTISSSQRSQLQPSWWTRRACRGLKHNETFTCSKEHRHCQSQRSSVSSLSHSYKKKFRFYNLNATFVSF